MSIQFESIKNQTSGIRAWGNLEQDTIVVQVRVSSGVDLRTTKTGKCVFHRGKRISDFVDDSDVGISDIYWKQDGEWLAKFGTIKSMTGLSNKEIGKLVQRLQENGKFSGDMENSQWEDIILEKGELIFVDDWKDIAAEEIVIEQTPTDPDEFDSWLDTIIGIIGEVTQATPEQLRKLGTALDTLGKELEDSDEEESVVDMLESDEEEERLAMELIEEIKKGNKPLMDIFTKLMGTPEEVIETPVKLNESPIANKIISKKSKPEPALSDNDWKEVDESWEKDEKKYWKEMEKLKKELEETKRLAKRLEYTPPVKSWSPKVNGPWNGEQEMTNQEITNGRKRQENFLDRILDEMVFCEPMSIGETQKRWEETWRKMSKEWQQEAMDRRRREQELKSKWNLFYGLTGITPPWSKENPREPEPWEPQF